jgi:hypothetical protein
MTSSQRTSGLAVASLILGIISLLGGAVCGAPIAAIVCGHLALGQIKRSAGHLGGRGLAVAGLITGYLALIAGIALLAFFLGIVGLGAKWESDQKEARIQREEREAQQARAAAGDLAQYTGTYQCGELTLRLSVENDILRTKSPDTTCEMRPLGRDLFVFQRCTKPVQARLAFNRNDRGEIGGATIKRYDLTNQSCKRTQ